MHARSLPLLGPRDMHAQPAALAHHGDGPGPTAHGAILDEHALRIRIDIEVDPLAAVRAANANRVLHP